MMMAVKVIPTGAALLTVKVPPAQMMISLSMLVQIISEKLKRKESMKKRNNKSRRNTAKIVRRRIGRRSARKTMARANGKPSREELPSRQKSQKCSLKMLRSTQLQCWKNWMKSLPLVVRRGLTDASKLNCCTNCNLLPKLTILVQQFQSK